MKRDIEHSSFRQTMFYGGPVIAYAGLIYCLSSLSRFPEETPSFAGFDKIAHFGEYFIFGWLINRWLIHVKWPFIRRNTFFITIFIGIAYALGDEWHQSFVPGRDASLWDVIADAVGVSVAAFVYRIVNYNQRFSQHAENGNPS